MPTSFGFVCVSTQSLIEEGHSFYNNSMDFKDTLTLSTLPIDFEL